MSVDPPPAAGAPDPTPAAPSRRQWRRLRWLVALAAGGLVLCGVCHRPILTGLAAHLVQEEPRSPVVPVHTVLLLDCDRRFDILAELRNQGAVHVLIYQSPPNRLEQLGVIEPELQITRRELVRRGLGDLEVEVLRGTGHQRPAVAASAGAWLAAHPEEQICGVCDRFNSRTWNRVFRQALAPDLLTRVRLRPIADRQYDETNWWRSKAGLMALTTDSVRLWFYTFQPEGDAPRRSLTAADFQRAFTRESEP